MENLSIDLETYCDVDLSKCGVYRYAESDSFEILLFGYAVDGGDVKVVDLAHGERIPDDILDALTDDSATLELPLSLKDVGAVLQLEDQKLTEGKALIRYFCVPCATSKADGGRTRNLPTDALEKWTLFKTCNRRDVEVEMAIQRRLARFLTPDSVWDEYHIDQEIIDRDMRVGMTLAANAIRMDERSKAELTERLRALTGLEDPNNVQQMKTWLAAHGVKTDTLGRKTVGALVRTAPADTAEVLELQQRLAKSSVRKYETMRHVACADDRARGMFQFYGQTGRVASPTVLSSCRTCPKTTFPTSRLRAPS